MLIRAEMAQLLVVDLQERLLPSIHGSDQVLANATVLLQAAERGGLEFDLGLRIHLGVPW